MWQGRLGLAARAGAPLLHPVPNSRPLTPAPAEGSPKTLSALAFARPADFPMGRRRPQGAVTRLCASPLLGHPLRGLALRARGIRVENSDKKDINSTLQLQL